MGNLGAWAAAAHVVLFALGTILFLPVAIFGRAGGLLFGPLWGTVYNLCGATLGATAAFLVGRYLAADWMRRRAGPRLRRLIDGVEAEGWRFVVFVRLVPLFPFGGCLCSAVRFVGTGTPKGVLWCHCQSCRGHSGAPVSVFAGVEQACRQATADFGQGMPSVSTPWQLRWAGE